MPKGGAIGRRHARVLPAIRRFAALSWLQMSDLDHALSALHPELPATALLSGAGA